MVSNTTMESIENFLDLFEGDDETILDPQDLADGTAKECQKNIHEAVLDIANVWLEFGLPERRRIERMGEIIDLIRETMRVAAVDERESLKKVIEYKQEKYLQINEMLSALHLNQYEMPTGMSLFALVKVLRAKFEELKKIKDERMKQFGQLQMSWTHFCDRLGQVPNVRRLKTSIPAEEELVELQSYVQDLKKKADKRFAQFLTVQVAIEELFLELNNVPRDEFEEQLLNGKKEEFVLSERNMNKLHDIHHLLEKHSEQNKVLKQKIIDRLHFLWERLEVPMAVRKDIIEQYTANSDATIEALKMNELAKVETVRKERLGEFIEKVRPVVKDVWELCCLTKDEQEMLNTQLDSFPPESEECLEAWEKELEDKKTFYREREDTFKNLDTLNAEWSEFLALEQIEKDPERYKNRKIPSTQIMKEQQRKRKLESSIKKSERILEKLSNDYEAKGNPFLIFGTLLKDYVKAKRDNYDQMKENEKAQKKQEKTEKLQMEMMGWGKNVPKGLVLRKTPVKRALGNTMSSTQSPASPNKLRRLNQQIIDSDAKRNAGPSSGPINRIGNGTKGVRKPLKFEPALLPALPAASGATGSHTSLLSVDEEQFQADLKHSKNSVNSTFKDDFVTRRRDKKAELPLQKVNFGHGLRRKSRSYANLNVAFNTLTVAGQRGGMVSTPVSPAKRCTPKSTLEKRRPFLP